MLLTSLIILVSVIVVVAFLFVGGKDTNGYSWIQFYARGKDAGFAWREINLLRQVAVKAELEEPSTLFWSVRQLDLCIRTLLKKVRLTGQEKSPETQLFLTKLYDYRKKIEFENPRLKKGINSSRVISESQHLRLLVEKVGVFSSVVLRNSDRYLTIACPSDPRLPADFVWKGHRVAVYFWRRDDAGYVFDTYVLDSGEVKNQPCIQLAHSDALFRTQKRRSVRTKTRLSAYLYFAKADAPRERIETEPGLRCIVEDLSEDGCAVTIGGKAAPGLLVKIQFVLVGEPLAMTGVVRSVDFSAEANRSLLHIEAERLSAPTRNRILAEVFDVQPETGLGVGFAEFDAETAGAAEAGADAGPAGENVAAVDEGLENPDILDPPESIADQANTDRTPSGGRADAVPGMGGS